MMRLPNLRPPTCCGLATVLAMLSACESPTVVEAPELDAPSFANGNGAIVTRFEDGNIFFPTADTKSGLLGIHYGSATTYEVFIGCPVPPFEAALSVKQIQTPPGKVLRQVSGETFVRVFDLAAFPGNVFGCGDPIAQGPIALHGVLHPDRRTGTQLGSNGVITNTADGSDVLLHHTVTVDGSFPNPGTIRLR